MPINPFAAPSVYAMYPQGTSSSTPTPAPTWNPFTAPSVYAMWQQSFSPLPASAPVGGAIGSAAANFLNNPTPAPTPPAQTDFLKKYGTYIFVGGMALLLIAVMMGSKK